MVVNNIILLAEETAPLGERMKIAGLNTALGLGIVFVALAFIALIIGIEGKIFQAIDKRKAAPAVVAAPVSSAPVEEDVSDDEELAAVITAAIYAYEAAQGADVPADGLVVRSIRRRGL